MCVVGSNACSLALFRSRRPCRRRQPISLKGSTGLKLTIDSSEALEDTLRVVGALYNVNLEASPTAATSRKSNQGTGNTTSSSSRTAPETRKSAQRRPGKRKTSQRTRSGRPRASSGSGGRVTTAAVRTWARENGYTVADRGRVPTDVVTAYRNAPPA